MADSVAASVVDCVGVDSSAALVAALAIALADLLGSAAASTTAANTVAFADFF